MPITLHELAKAAGCSVSTVSRALTSSSHRVNDSTKERILTLANELGYHPNMTARGLKTDRTFTIGLIVYNIASPFTPVLVRGIQEYLKQRDYFSILISTDWDPKLESEAVHQLISRSIDGIIFVESWREDPGTSIDLANKPYVFVYQLFNGSYSNSVNLDDRYGARLAVDHLIKLGHRRVALINGPHGWNSSIERMQGYQDSLKQYQIPFDSSLVMEGDWEIQSGYHATLKFLGMANERPSAIYAANDLMALGAIYAIQDAGLKVPENMAIVGCDDRDFASFSKPTITTVSPPSFEMGQMAAQLILNQLENQVVLQDHIRVKGKLIVRESCGAKQAEVPPEHYVSHTNPPESLVRRWRGKDTRV